MSSSFSTISGMPAERGERHLAVVLRADRQQDAAPDQLLQRHLEVLEGLAGGAAAEHDPVDPVVADDAAPEGVVEVEHDRPAREAEPGGEDGGGVARHQRQALGGEGHLRHVPAAVVEPVPGAHAAGEEREVDEAHVLGDGLSREVAVDAGDDAPPGAVEAERVVAERVGAGDREAHLQDGGGAVAAARRRTAGQTPDQRATSAATSASGVSVKGRTPRARCSGARTSTSRSCARSAEPGSRVALKYWPKSGWWMVSARPSRAAARRSSGAKALVVQVPTRPTRQVAADPRPGLHRAAREQPRRRRPGAEAAGGVDHGHQPGRRRLGPPGGEMGAGELDAEPAARELGEVRGLLVGVGGGVEPAGEQVGVADLLERGELAVDVAHGRAGSSAGRAGRGPGARRGGGVMMRAGGAVTMLPAGTLVITTQFGPMRHVVADADRRRPPRRPPRSSPGRRSPAPGRRHRAPRRPRW